MRNLLITTIGSYNHFSAWIDGERNFDIAVVIYDNSRHEKINNITCVYWGSFPTFKYPGIKEMFWQEPFLLDYDYFWMPDEDIWARPNDINMLFDKMRELDIWIGHPSVLNADDSFPSRNYFTHKEGFDVIYTSFIEVGCPCFSSNALTKCLPLFDKSKSGWGLDIVWSAIGKDKKMAILNNVMVKHTRRVGEGRLYDKLRETKIFPSQERKKLMAEYGIKEVNIKTWI